MKRKEWIRFFLVLLISLIVIGPLCIVILHNMQGNIRMENISFKESARELRNPGRGFYNLYRFMISDEKENYWQLVQQLYREDTGTSLTLVEINLQQCRDGEISEAGMVNITSLFEALEDVDKQLIVRFLYDWDGENEKYEPETVDIILHHMGQVERVLREFSGQIFIVQGLFTGNWGEMNGTKYFTDKDLTKLAEKMGDVTDRGIYLAVRTPEQWRRITGLEEVTEETLTKHPLAERISLYNDGMLGSESDYGTYRVHEVNGKKISEREAELTFQEALCSWVPNGGEVINDNAYNDFEQARKDLAAMHVTYLNAGHDQAVLEKWKKAKVTEEGCYQGMDGYTYMERHLGYRLLIEKSVIQHSAFWNHIEVSVTMKNAGFAPLYRETKTTLLFHDKESDQCLTFEMDGDLRSLAGGNESEKILKLKTQIPVEELMQAKYEVYFSVVDVKTGQKILFANEQDAEMYGYRIGSVEILK